MILMQSLWLVIGDPIGLRPMLIQKQQKCILKCQKIIEEGGYMNTASL
jgi:hypothetical protein